jgi:hypothetical protein
MTRHYRSIELNQMDFAARLGLRNKLRTGFDQRQGESQQRANGGVEVPIRWRPLGKCCAKPIPVTRRCDAMASHLFDWPESRHVGPN